MKLQRTSRRKLVARRGEAAILFAVGPYSFLIAAEEVDEIREMHELVSVSADTMRTSIEKIRSTLKKSGKTYFVVDGSLHFQMMPSHPTRLMILRNQPVAVTVDSIDRMTEIDRVLPLPKAFTCIEREWYRGLAVISDRVIPVVNGNSFLTAAEQVIARKALGQTVQTGASA